MAAAQSAPFDTAKTRVHDRAGAIARVTMVARLFDSAFLIPGINRRVGLDAVIGLVPGIGDAVSAALAGYIVWEARRLGLPRWKIARMVGQRGGRYGDRRHPLRGRPLRRFLQVERAQPAHHSRASGMPKRGPREIDGTVVPEGRT